MYIITVLQKDETQLQCCVGSWKDAIDFACFLEESNNVIKFKISTSFTQKQLYFNDSKKWVDSFYGNNTI